MKKGAIFILLIVFVLSLYIYPSYVFSQEKITPRPPESLPVKLVMKFMGGRIVSVPAFEIYSLQSGGFICPVMGKTISIHPMGSPAGTPTSYYIPFSVPSQTRTSIRGMGQLILARYTVPTFITCTHPTGATTQVSLQTIDLYGTSR